MRSRSTLRMRPGPCAAAALAVAAAGTVGASVGQPAYAEPPGRAYELVSLADTRGDDLRIIVDAGAANPPFPRVSADGDHALYTSVNSLLGQNEGGWGNSYQADRGPTGWTTRYVGPPGTHAWRGAISGVAPGFDRHLVTVLTGRPIDPEDTDPDVETRAFPKTYRRDREGRLTLVNTGSAPAPITVDETGAPLDENGTTSPWNWVPLLRAYNADLSRVLFVTDRTLEPGPIRGFYLREGDRTLPVGGAGFTNAPNYLLGRPTSADLERIYFAGRPQLPTGDGLARILLWRGPELPPVEISRSRRAVPAPAEPVSLVAVSDDGTSVLLATNEPLTDDDGDSARDFYRYRLPATGDPADGSLERISVGPAGGDGPAQVQFVGASADHEVVYFLSSEALTSGAQQGTPNLYVRDGAGTRLVTVLSAEDANEFVYDDDAVSFGSLVPAGEGDLHGRGVVRVSEDGRLLLFISRSALAGAQPAGHEVVYRYDEAARELACVSCPPGGSPATSDSWFGLQGGGRNMTADGAQVFFQTKQALVARDSNARDDVYAFDAATGEVSLVSPGNGDSAAEYYDNSEDGRDVFFLTREALTRGDRNGDAVRLYDARIGGGFPETPPTACSGDECLGLPSPAAVLPGAGSTAVGPSGNIRRGVPVFKVDGIGAKQRTAWSRTGKVTLRVRVSKAGRVRARATALLRGRRRTVASSAQTVPDPGTARLRLALSEAARTRLKREGRLRVTVAVEHSGASASQRLTVMLRRAGAAARGGQR